MSGLSNELLERIRNAMVELLSHQSGGKMSKTLGEVADEVGTARRTVSGGDEHSRDIIQGSGHQRSAGNDDIAVPAAQSVRERSAPTPAAHFELKLTQEDRAAFASIADKISLPSMVSDIEPMVWVSELRGTVFSASEKKVIAHLRTLQEEQGGRLADMNLKFRWVSASRELGVPKLAEDARVHGGAAPNDPWTHAGDNVAEDFMAQDKGPGVLFIYDGKKLVPPTKAEIEEQKATPGGKSTFMHAQKALPGLELKDALQGMIRFDGPVD